MPGNEVGDRIHNFFGQDNWSQGQHQAQAFNGTWNALNSNPWAGNHWQIGTPLISNLKNNNAHQPADTERGGESSSLQLDMNFPHSNPGPEFSRSQPESQQPPLNGYMHGHQVLHTRQNEANFLGVDAESDRCNMPSKGFSMLDSQLGNGPDFLKKNSVRMDFNESPVNHDFFRGQQQISGQHPGMLQPFPRQHSGISDMQVLQKQFMLKQMQEMQRQQQKLQKQQDSRKLNSANQVSAFAKQAAGNSQALINGIPNPETSNFLWQPELMVASTHWPERGVPPIMQGSFRGFMYSPEQGQATPCLMGMVPQQVDQSLYGVPISGTRVTSSQYSPVQMDKPSMQQISGSSNSLPNNQYTGFPEQVSVQDGTLVSRQGYQGKNMFASFDGHGINSGFNLENLQQQVNPQQSNGLVQESCSRQDLAGPSETSQEETATQVAPSENVVTLDPTEAKILFGSDDNLWDAFGRGASMGSRGHNMLNGTDFFSTMPSLQSGSWSALMQSAVAETSSDDTGLQEEWSGLSRNYEPPAGNQQTPTVNDSSKQQSNWADNSLQSTSSLNSRPFPVSHETNTGMGYNNILGVHPSGVNTPHEHSERLQTVSPHRHIQPFLGDGTKQSDRSLLKKAAAGGGHFYGKATHSSDEESNAKIIQSPWANQQSMPSYNSSGQPLSSPSGWNFLDSASPITTAALKNQGNEKVLQDSQNADKNCPMFEVMGHGADIWKTSSVSNSITELECAKSSMRSPLVNQEATYRRNVAALPDSSTEMANTESGQQLPKSNNIDVWKHAGLSLNHNITEIPGKYQPHMVKNDQTFESSGNSSLANVAVEMHEMQNSDTSKNPTDSFSNTAHHASGFGVRENAWLGVDDSCSLSGGKQKSTSNIGRKLSGIRKFQYHPMGDLDVDMEPSYGTKDANSQFTPQQLSQRLKGLDQGYIGQPNFPSHVARDSVEIEKGHMCGFQGEAKGLYEIPPKSILPGSAPGLSTPFERSVRSPNKMTSSSQNMLELLHKVDQSREHGNEMHFSSLNRDQFSEMPEAETSDASFHVQKNQSSTSQAFGLQLAPPSQQSLIPEHALPSQNPSNINSTCLAPTSSVQTLTPHETSHGHLRNAICSTSMHTGNSAQRKFSAVFSPGFPYSRSHLSTQPMTDKGGQATTNESVRESFDRFSSQPKQMEESYERGQTNQSAIPLVPDISRHTSHNDNASSEMSQPSGNNQNHARDSAQQFPVLETAPAPAPQRNALLQDTVSSKISPAMWTSVPTQLHPFSAQPFQALSSMFKPSLQSHNSLGTTFFQPQKPEDQIMQTGSSNQAESGVCSMNSHGFVGKEQLLKGDHLQQVSPENAWAQKTMSASHEKDTVANHLTETSLSNMASTQKQIEAFGRSLKPNNTLHQNYSLLHQMQGMKKAQVNHVNRSLNRFKSPDSSVDPQLVATQGVQQFYGLNNMVTDASENHTSIPHGDSEMLNFSGKTADSCDTNAPTKEILAFSWSDSQSFADSNGEVSVRGEHSHIGSQMAPSWFDQYGTFKNGKILRMHDARRTVTMKSSELPFATGRPDHPLHAHSSIEQGNAAASQFGVVQKSSTRTSIASENFSSPQSLQPDSADVSLVLMRPKKRKSVISELVTWREEVMHCPQRLQNNSAAEVDWARATNRLTEKVENELEMIDDGLPVLRSKRRVILTTQLMQILLCPPLASILSSDAILHYENAAYFVSRSTLGDACNTLSCTGSDTTVPSNSGDLLSLESSRFMKIMLKNRAVSKCFLKELALVVNNLAEKEKLSDKIIDQYFSKVMEDLISRTRKQESDLLRLDKRASVSDLRVECQDLERFSVINRFAKFHGRGQGDGAESSSSSDAQKSCLQRYVTALPMPRNLPDRVQCLSL